MKQSPIHAKDRLILALDVPSLKEAKRLMELVGESLNIVKIGLELYTMEGPSVVHWARGLGKRVFLDLKFLDIEETVRRATARVADMGVEFLTIHATRKTLRGAVAGRGARTNLKLLAVTLLTNHDADDLREMGTTWSVEDLVLARATMAKDMGCDGVVASGQEAERLRHTLGPRFVIVTPGVRPSGTVPDDQARVSTPSHAISSGADYLVVGRPIRDAQNPSEIIEALLTEMQAAFDKRAT